MDTSHVPRDLDICSPSASLSILLLYFIFTFLQHGGKDAIFPQSSVADPDLKPDPYVFGPSGFFHSIIRLE